MAAFNSNYYLPSRYGLLSPPPLSTSLPYDLSTTATTNLLSDRLLSPIYNPRIKPKPSLLTTNYNQIGSLNTLTDTLLIDDLSDETDRILNNRLNFLNNNNNVNINKNKLLNKDYKQQQQQQNKLKNNTFVKTNNSNNSASTEDEVLTNKIDRRLSKVRVNNIKPNNKIKLNSRLSNGNNIQQQSQYPQTIRSKDSNNFIDNDFNQNSPQYKQKFNIEVLQNNNIIQDGKYKGIKRENHIQPLQYQNTEDEHSQQISQASDNNNNNYKNNFFENDNEIDNELYSPNNNNNNNNNDQKLFIYREIPPNNQNFDYNPEPQINNQGLKTKGNSADMEIKTVSSMLSSVNQSPDTNKIEAHRQTPFSKNSQKLNGPKKLNGVANVNTRDLSTAYSNFRELNYDPDSGTDFDDQSNQYRKYDQERDTNISKIQYYKESTNETIYKRDTINRIKPIVVRGDIAFGKDSILPENNKQKLDKEEKRKIYGDLVKRRNNQLSLNDNRSLVYSVADNDKRKKSSKFETRKVYSRLVKEINDDEYFQQQQKEIIKSTLPQIEKRGEELVKQKKQKIQKIKKKNEYSEFVKDRNQVLIDDQRKQRELKAKVRRINDFEHQSYALKYGADNEYAKSFKKQSYFVDLKDESSKDPVIYENDLENLNDELIDNNLNDITNINTYRKSNHYKINNKIIDSYRQAYVGKLKK